MPERATDVDVAGDIWHLKVCYLTERCKRLYNSASQGEVGTWAHLQALLDWKSSCLTDVKHHVYDLEAFCDIVDTAHIGAAFATFLGMETLDSAPPFVVPDIPTLQDMRAMQELLAEFITALTAGMTSVPPPRGTRPCSMDEWIVSLRAQPKATAADGVRAYACDTAVSGLLLMELKVSYALVMRR